MPAPRSHSFGVRGLTPLAQSVAQSDDVMVRCARAYAEEFAKNPAHPRLSTIAKAAKCSRNSVRAHLLEAQRRDLLTLVLRLPKDETLSDRLAGRYHLAEAVVTLSPTTYGDQESVRAALAAEAIWYLERACSRFAALCGENAELRVGLDGGLTLYQAAHQPRPLVLPRLQYRLVPLVFGPLGGSSYTATVVANVLASKIEALRLDVEVRDPFTIHRDSGVAPAVRGGMRFSLEMQPDAAAALDLLFVGIGSKSAGLFYREIAQHGKRGRLRQHFGDVLSLGFDKNGRALEFAGGTHSVLLDLEQLRSVARGSAALVVAVAGGEAKVDAIRVVLEQGYVSVLITDRETAEALVASK